MCDLVYPFVVVSLSENFNEGTKFNIITCVMHIFKCFICRNETF